jgi:hypothetical protein
VDIAIYGEKKKGMLLEADGPRNAKGESEKSGIKIYFV